jgi:hypothetical protein
MNKSTTFKQGEHEDRNYLSAYAMDTIDKTTKFEDLTIVILLSVALGLKNPRIISNI